MLGFSGVLEARQFVFTGSLRVLLLLGQYISNELSLFVSYSFNQFYVWLVNVADDILARAR